VVGQAAWWDKEYLGPYTRSYAIVIAAYLEKRLSVREFSQIYMQLFKTDNRESRLRQEDRRALERLFFDLDDFVDDPRLRNQLEGDIDEDELRSRAATTLKMLRAS
jgi:hypothetical protein